LSRSKTGEEKRKDCFGEHCFAEIQLMVNSIEITAIEEKRVAG
jgi:hypothetical protein